MILKLPSFPFVLTYGCLEEASLVSCGLAFSGTCLTFMPRGTLHGSASEHSTGGSFSSCIAAEKATSTACKASASLCILLFPVAARCLMTTGEGWSIFLISVPVFFCFFGPWLGLYLSNRTGNGENSFNLPIFMTDWQY